MFRVIVAILAFTLFTAKNSSAQTVVTKTFTTTFHPKQIAYNASPDPRECWEAVEWVIEIKTDKGTQVFSVAYKDIGNLKQKIGDAEVAIEVLYFDEPEEGSGAVGTVQQISLNGLVIYKSE